jgi:ABC-type branched-subunit amino acid transport system ATPase component
MAEEILQAINIVKEFKGIRALHKVSLSVRSGEVLGLIGPNGAGKTTLLNVLNGFYKPEAGEVQFKGVRLTGRPLEEIARLGMSRTFQITRVFRRLSVLENLLAPCLQRPQLRPGARRRALELLELVRLADKRNQYAYELSGGQQKLLEFARALMADPELVLMDEPFAGVHPEIKAQLLEALKEMNRRGKTFVIVSHDMRTIADLCHRVVALAAGEKLAEGLTQEVFHHPAVIEAYLGREAGARS